MRSQSRVWAAVSQARRLPLGDLALSQESARDGVRGLPDLFGRLPELEALLL
ncbi:hypothetical protein ACFOY4_23265 [Actinomadura syzygii]|uniref:hypothetical protein n=1 Tax=Actinomadura syzygii TaxID=1427538 RepID=UPI001CA35860|nr:hypothetical protein [Actinomadura syzygii]